MDAKRFFYVCAGLLCLALAYHLGARSAAAIGNGIAGPEIRGENDQIDVTLSVNRFVSGFHRYVSSGYVALSPPNGPVPGTDDIVATHLLPGGTAEPTSFYWPTETSTRRRSDLDNLIGCSAAI